MVTDGGNTTLVRRQLGRRLRALREQAGKSIEDVIGTSIVSRSKLWRMEAGRSVVRQGDVLSLARLYGVDLTKIDDLLALADATKATGFQEDYGSSMPEWVGIYGNLEAGAAELRDYSPELIHGLLQTEAYARAVTQVNPSLAPDVVEQRVAFRMRRQRGFFERPKPGRLEVVVTAGAAELQVGSPAVMEEQIAHIRAVVEDGTASVSVLARTNGVHSAMRGPFTIMDFDDEEDPSLVYVENLVGSRYLERPDHIAEFRNAFARMQALAVPFEE